MHCHRSQTKTQNVHGLAEYTTDGGKLSVVPWETLPSDVQILAEQAANGSLQSFQNLVNRMHRDQQVAVQPRILTMLYDHLAKSPPRHFQSKTKTTATDFAKVAIDGVTATFLAVGGLHGSSSLEPFQQSWPALWPWVMYFYRRLYPDGLFRHRDPASFTESERALLKRIQILVPRLVGFNATTSDFAALGEPPDAFFTVADIWVRVSETGLNDSGIFAGIIMSIVEFFRRDLHKWPRLLVEKLDGGISKLASLCLSSIRMVVDGKEHWMQAFNPLLGIMMAMGHAVPNFDHALLSQHIIVEVTRAFSFFTTKCLRRAVDGHFGFLTVSNSATCLSFIAACTHVTDGFTWITQAIRYGLIPSLLRCGILPQEAYVLGLKGKVYADGTLSYDAIENSAIDMIKILSVYVVYRSILRQLERALRDPKVSILESQLPRSSRLLKAWLIFKSFVEQRLQVKTAFDEAGYAHRCGASTCNMVESTEAFRLCAGCQMTSYCSKECQVRDWKFGGHREACKKLQKDRAGGIPSPVSLIDTMFISFAFKYDMDQRRGDILKARNEVLAGKETSEYVIFLDYSVHPMSIMVDSSDAFAPATRHLVSRGVSENKTTSPLVSVVLSIPHGVAPAYSVLRSDKYPDFLQWALDGIGSDQLINNDGNIENKEGPVDDRGIGRLPQHLTDEDSELHWVQDQLGPFSDQEESLAKGRWTFC